MNQNTIESIIKFMNDKLFVRRAWLFGSRVKGTANPESDLDIAIEIKGNHDEESDFSFWFYNDKKLNNELRNILDIIPHIEHYDSDTKVKEFVDKHGILIYARDTPESVNNNEIKKLLY